ncbi:MAG: glycosyltransferase [Lachnospiraceae bacterium]|nr:glycosyltransferase [Lachnospiraceae bacterium]
MRILLCEWGTFNEPVIEKTLRDIGHFVRVIKREEAHKDDIEAEVLYLANAAREYHADIFFSVDYFNALASAAKQAGILYYSWLFHLPQWNLYSYQAQLPCNRIFIFDRAQIEELKRRNVQTAQYLSLPADKQLFENAMEGAATKKNKYQADVSFVGSIYESANNIFNHMKPEDRETETYKQLVELIKEKKFSYGRGVLRRGVSDEMVQFLAKATEGDRNNYFFAEREDIALQSVLARKITVEERKTVCRLLSRKFDMKVYTVSNTERYPEIINCGPVDFQKQAPLIFNQSKINVYVTPRAIQTGIPGRVLEIIACQGFVLTNYQEDLAAEFEEGKEIVMYRSLEDLVAKTNYYLTHEEERQSIIRAGYEKVMREYNYAEKLRKILDTRSGSNFGF